MNNDQYDTDIDSIFYWLSFGIWTSVLAWTIRKLWDVEATCLLWNLWLNSAKLEGINQPANPTGVKSMQNDQRQE